MGLGYHNKTMGYNICGMLTRLQSNQFIKTVKKEGSYTLNLQKNIDFEEAISSKYDTNIIDLYSTQSGTLILTSEEFFPGIEDIAFLSDQEELVQFMISETAMIFAFRYYKSGRLVNEDIYSYEPEFQFQGENRLRMTSDNDIVDDGFSELVNSFLGVSFNAIDLSEKAVRYSLNFKTT